MKTTREGRRFILATLLLAVAAVNTGNNLIYLILSLMLSFLLLSVFILRANLSGLSLTVSVPHPVFAGESAQAVFSLTNRSRFLKTWSVKVSSPEIRASVYFPEVMPGASMTMNETVSFPRRGLYRYGDFSAISSFPFILFEARRVMPLDDEVLVYPQITDVEHLVSASAGAEEYGAARKVMTGEDLYGLREFRHGDDWRQIHWKASAKTGGLLVREYAEHDSKKASVLLDNAGPPHPEHFEKAVALAASVCRYYIERGYLTRLLSCRKVVPFGAGEEHLFTILDILAVIREVDGWDCPAVPDEEGCSVLIMKSPSSPLSGYAETCDRVVHAGSL